MKYLNIFLSILIVIILGIYLFYIKCNSSKEYFQETQPTRNILFNIKSIVDDPSRNLVCSLRTYRYPERQNLETQKNTIGYIIDSNLYQLSQLEAFTIMYQKDLKELHSKTFSGGVNLTNVSLMGCGEHDITNKNVGIEVFSSDLFLNNLGKRKTTGKKQNTEKKHHFALNLYEETEANDDYIELPIDKKKKVIVYPETILRLTQYYTELLDGLNRSPQGTTSASGSSPSVTLDQIINSDIIDNNIYNLFYESSMTDDQFRILLFRVLGIDEDLFDNTNILNDKFKIVKTAEKTKPSCPRDDEMYCYYEDLVTNCGNIDKNTRIIPYLVNVLRNNFRFVYYKDVMFSTDVAFWRTNIYNKLQENNVPPTTQSGTTQASNIPEHINKFTVYSSEEGQRENIISLLLKIADYKQQIKILSNLNRYDSLGNEVVLKKNKDVLRRKILHYENLILNYAQPQDVTMGPTLASDGELIDLTDIVTQGINRSTSGCDGCESIRPKINQNGEIVPPSENEVDIPEYVTNIFPPYPGVTSQVCSMTTPACIEQFTSCSCQTYKLTYNFNNKTETLYILIDGVIDINNFSSMYTSSESDRFHLLKLNIELFNPYTPVNAGQKFIEYAQLFHNIPTQLKYISNLP